MLLSAPGILPEPNRPGSLTPADSGLSPALDLAAEIVAAYEISALSGLLASARAALAQDEIAVAVLGRFKAGKSSFLNQLIAGPSGRRGPLPAGVVPVTAAITEIRYGPRELARVHYQDGRSQTVPLDRIGALISEKENPRNHKQVALLTVELPELMRFRGLKFVDTPGLDSALAHNTQTSLDWLPNVGLALVAVSVDPPLSQRDIDLLKSLYQYTPEAAVLLTKADLLSQSELSEVTEYVRAQLAGNLPGTPRVFPYSIQPGFGPFRQELEAWLVAATLGRFAAQRESIAARKIDTLLGECAGYLALGLKSAEMVEAERHDLKRQVIGEKEVVEEVKSAVRLVVQHAAAGTRSMVSGRLETHQRDLQQALLQDFQSQFPRWTASLAVMLSSFEEWVAGALRERLTALSIRERGSFLAPLHQVRQQTFRAMQQFRDRLSDRALRVFGVPLRTTETEIHVAEPATPDIRVGRVFDRNWELLSPMLPVWLIQPVVRRHFARTIPHAVFQNLSRLGAQWEESVNAALGGVRQEAGRRLDELMGTVERLLETGGGERAPQLRADLERIRQARHSLAERANGERQVSS